MAKRKSRGTAAPVVVQPSPGLFEFELDLMGAVLDQLLPVLQDMMMVPSAPLTEANVKMLPEAQGVYLLIHDGKVKYVGKTDASRGLHARLSSHVRKFQQRKGIDPVDVQFKAAHIFVLTAMDIEKELIDRYSAEWNGSSFGSNDPGRERETTDKATESFYVQYPIDVDLVGVLPFPAGQLSVHEVLWRLKDALPYCFRYQTLGKKSSHAYRLKPHPDYEAAYVTVDPNWTVRELLLAVCAALPTGWQVTLFPSHVILYHERRVYEHGTSLMPLSASP